MISVITASLPSRAAMLAECVASNATQTRPPIEHLVGVDHARRGSAATRNALLSASSGTRVAVLDDDDVAYPLHLERLAMSNADIVYSYCDEAFGGPLVGFWWYPCQERIREERVAQGLPSEPPGDESEKALYWRRQGLEYAKDHLGELPKVIVARVARQWELFRP